MKLLSMVTAVGQMLDSERADVTLSAALCVHSQNKAATCDRCVQACPVEALTLDSTITLDAEACVKCGLCLYVCPVDAFSGNDGLADLLAAVARLPKHHIVELACAAHPVAEKGPGQSDAVLRTAGCLAALGPAAYLSLFALGVAHLVLRLDACHACPLGKVRREIEGSVSLACRLAVGEDGAAQLVSLAEMVREDWPLRRVTAVDHPTRSRREFFKSLTAVDEPPQIIRKLASDEPPTAGKHPPQERRRLLAAWRNLPSGTVLDWTPALLEALSFAQITADSNCTACGVCDRVCPTGALQLVVDDADEYQLTFTAGNCVGCGLCLAFCEPGALQRYEPAYSAQLVAGTAIILRHGRLQRCRRCGASVAGEAVGDLCSVCEFRSKQPFGSHSPNRHAN